MYNNLLDSIYIKQIHYVNIIINNIDENLHINLYSKSSSLYAIFITPH